MRDLDRARKRNRENHRKKRLNPEFRIKDNARAREFMRRLREKDPEYCKKVYWKRKAAGYYLKYHYGLSSVDYSQLLDSQNGQCPICKVNLSKIQVHVDHDHITGTIRGLLCRDCNILLGLAKDSKEILLSAVGYLER